MVYIGEIMSIDGDKAKVFSDGYRPIVDISLLSNIKPGDNVIVHGGCAIKKIIITPDEEINCILSNIGVV